MDAKSTSTATSLSYLALGDSYTIGEGVPAQQRWPSLLASKLRARGLNLRDPQIIATTSWTTDELATGIKQADLQSGYSLVSLSIGVNNQYRGRNLDNYRHQFSELLQRAIDLAGARPQRVFVLSIADWSVTPFAQSSGRDLNQEALKLAAYNQVKRQISETSGVAFFDITASALEAKNDNTFMGRRWPASDGQTLCHLGRENNRRGAGNANVSRLKTEFPELNELDQ